MKHEQTYPIMWFPANRSWKGLLPLLLEVCPQPVFIMLFRDYLRSKHSCFSSHFLNVIFPLLSGTSYQVTDRYENTKIWLSWPNLGQLWKAFKLQKNLWGQLSCIRAALQLGFLPCPILPRPIPSTGVSAFCMLNKSSKCVFWEPIKIISIFIILYLKIF